LADDSALHKFTFIIIIIILKAFKAILIGVGRNSEGCDVVMYNKATLFLKLQFIKHVCM